MKAARKLSEVFQVLSAPARVRILLMLKKGPLCVGALCMRLGITQSAVSQHLRVLRQAGLVATEKRGAFVHYHIDEKNLAKWKEAVVGLFEPGSGNGCLSNTCNDEETCDGG